jgi:hypothetical protein
MAILSFVIHGQFHFLNRRHCHRFKKMNALHLGTWVHNSCLHCRAVCTGQTRTSDYFMTTELVP